MRNIVTILLGAALVVPFSTAFAGNPTPLACPQIDAVKAVKFNKAIQNPFLLNAWYLISDDFQWNGNKWNVWFGVVLPNAKNAIEAVNQGEALYPIAVANTPTSYIYNNMSVCNYVPVGRDDSISAINPPQYSIPPLQK